jgi:lipid A oxidase
MRVLGVAAGAAMVLLSAQAAQAEFAISVYGGATTSFDSFLESPGFTGTVRWSGQSFKLPPIWGVSATYWLTGSGNGEWGIRAEYVHTKVAADPLPAGMQVLEFTDGLNIATADVLHRWRDFGPVTPYLGLGVGATIPHVEYKTVGGPETFEYQLAGPAAELVAGADYKFNDYVSIFGEYRAAFTINKAHTDGGGPIHTNILTNLFLAGLTVSFGP